MAVKRLDKLLSELGLASRSELKQIIKSGRISVDGVVLTSPEIKIDTELCRICFDGVEISTRKLRYFMLNKPAGYICATEDKTQETVLDLLPPELRKLGLFPVGRLDKDTEGLLLLTNDGDFSHRVISPRSGIAKLYLAEVEGKLNKEDITAFEAGITLGDGTKCQPARLEILSDNRCLVTVTEGKYHQVKRMLASCGKHVTKLSRLAIGALELDERLQSGTLRELDESDLCKVLYDKILGI